MTTLIFIRPRFPGFRRRGSAVQVLAVLTISLQDDATCTWHGRTRELKAAFRTVYFTMRIRACSLHPFVYHTWQAGFAGGGPPRLSTLNSHKGFCSALDNQELVEAIHIFVLLLYLTTAIVKV